MNLDTLFDNLFWLVFVAILGAIAWRMLKHGGVRGAMFDSRVERLVGEVEGKKQAMNSFKVRVHRLAGSSETGEIGLELVAKSIASYQMAPVTLSREAALQLAEHLRTAAQK